MKAPTEATVKTLFAYSGNTCAHRECEEQLTDPSWNSVVGRVCHIRGSKQGSARYDESMTDEVRHHYDNLILLCANCHVRIDDTQPDAHPPELLTEMKLQHEGRAARLEKWTTAANLNRFVEMAVAVMTWESRGGGSWGGGTWGGGTEASPTAAPPSGGGYGSDAYGEGSYGGGGPPTQIIRPAGIPSEEAVGEPTIGVHEGLAPAASGPRVTRSPIAAPRLVLQQRGTQLFAVNNSGADAYIPVASIGDGGASLVLLINDEPPRRLSPGAELKIGTTMPGSGAPAHANVRLTWQDADGRPYDADFSVS